MKTTVKIWYEEKYLPNKRCRKLRTRVSNKDVDVDVREVTENEFPIAFVVHDMQSVYEGATSYSDFDGNGDYKMHTEDIRTYAGKLYKPIRISCGTAISTLFEPLAEMKYKLMEPEPYWMGGEDFSDQSIVKSDNFTEKLKIAKEKASSYLIYEKKIWAECNEPMYNIETFGLGHNHGGTGFFITWHYNPNISKDNYFNALQRDEAIAYGKRVALGRGDTESVDRMGEYDFIEVKIPEMVKHNPQTEHGNGDPFMNKIEGIISNSDSAAEAGILTVVATIADLH